MKERMKRTSMPGWTIFYVSLFSCSSAQAATIERRGKQGEAIELCVGWRSFDEPANDARAFIEERGVSTEAATQGGQTRRMEGREPLHN